MIKYAKIEGMKGGDDLPVLDITEMDKAIGNISEWALLLDPEQIMSSLILNRCTGENCINDGALSVVSSNNVPFFAFKANSNPAVSCDVDLNSDAITIFGVVKLTQRSTESRQTLITAESFNTILGINFGFTHDGKKMLVSTRGGVQGDYTQGNSVRIEYIPTVPFLERTAYVMMTFNTKDGFKLYENGRLVAQNSSDLRPFISTESVNYSALRAIAGQVGLVGVINKDLSTVASAEDKKALDSFMISKYNIAT